MASGIRTDADAEGGLFPGFIGEIDAADLQSLRAAVEASKIQFFEASTVVALTCNTFCDKTENVDVLKCMDCSNDLTTSSHSITLC